METNCSAFPAQSFTQGAATHMANPTGISYYPAVGISASRKSIFVSSCWAGTRAHGASSSGNERVVLPMGLWTGLSPLVGIRTNKLLRVYPRAQYIVEIYSVVKPEETLKIASLLPSNTFLYQSLTCSVNCKSTLMVFSCRMPSCSLFSIARQLNG